MDWAAIITGAVAIFGLVAAWINLNSRVSALEVKVDDAKDEVKYLRARMNRHLDRCREEE